ncbi:M48 family metallopeptidase [Aurantibacillus circumpalustris]|uniref:M48 family metallopeptidase n=1 Tax=Aurantibacillus circumpalustris TaxID=3036359 RepID=UPI00295AA1CD|nr:M48 family metallopeptidase [Aurantibacillus circumpalustris]
MTFARVILLALLPSICFTQNEWYHYNWKQANKSESLDHYNYAYNYGAQKYRDNLFIGAQYKKFALQGALMLYEDFTGGKIYPSFNGYEVYIRKVMETIVKDTAVSNNIKIFFQRSDEFDASVDQSGYLLINVGLIAEIETEAELALILGHEIAHYVNDDVIKNYGRILEIKYPDKPSFMMLPGISGMVPNPGPLFASITYAVALYNNSSNYYWFSRGQETMADQYSFKLLNESRYNFDQACNVLKSFKRDEIRKEIQCGKISGNYVSHPDPGSRLNTFRSFRFDSLNGMRKNFQVDSLKFSQLKQICFEETVNIGMVENNLEKIILLCFTKYLLYPEDENNLAVLIEALRRYIFFGKENGVNDRSFILSWYQTPSIRNSENYAFLNEKNPSILNHLNKGFVNIWKEDFEKIKARELVDTTVVEFTTNMDAYLYFKEIAKKTENQPAKHINYFGSTANFEDVEEYVKTNTLFQTNDYLKEKGTLSRNKNELIVIIPPSIEDLFSLPDDFDLETVKRLNNALVEKFRKKINNPIVLVNELDCDEQHMVSILIENANYFLNLRPQVGLKETKIDWLEVCPELYSFFKKRDIEHVYFYKLSIQNDKKAIVGEYKISLPLKKRYSIQGTQSLRLIPSKGLKYLNIEQEAKKLNKFYKKLSD